MTADCYRQLAQALDQGAVVLATVTATRGSVPRETGAKMIIAADGRTFNTIGGGAGEAKVIRQALQVLQTGEKTFVDLDLSGLPDRDHQGVCGGWMRVWLERWSGQWAMALAHQILDCLQTGRSATVVMPFVSHEQPYLLFDSVALFNPDQAYVEPLQVPPMLLVVGAGHVGEQLAKVAHFAGFQIAVQDDRPDWANLQRYPQAALIVNQSIQTALQQLAAFPKLYIALVTRSYQHDLDALRAILQRQLPCKYIGMIGSEKRVRTVYQELQQSGISAQQLQQIYAPIGLELGALTPEEIAISICAELIQVRRGGTGESMSLGLRRLLAKTQGMVRVPPFS